MANHEACAALMSNSFRRGNGNPSPETVGAYPPLPEQRNSDRRDVGGYDWDCCLSSTWIFLWEGWLKAFDHFISDSLVCKPAPGCIVHTSLDE